LRTRKSSFLFGYFRKMVVFLVGFSKVVDKSPYYLHEKTLPFCLNCLDDLLNLFSEPKLRYCVYELGCLK